MNLATIRFRAIALGFCLAGMSHAALALKPADITPEERAMVPRFCADTQGFSKYGDASYNTSPNARKWVAMMGNGFWHMHHYCWGIVNFHRAMRSNFPAQHKNATLKDARGDFYYVVNNTGADFILLPEIFTWIGRISVAMKEYDEAENAFAKARSIKPDYWPPYYHHGEMLLMLGNKAEAREIVHAGLQRAPDAKPLQLLYRDLGDKPEDLPASPPVTRKP